MTRNRLVTGLVVMVALGAACGEDPPPPALVNPAGLAAHAALFREATGTPQLIALGTLAKPLQAFGASVTALATAPMKGKTIEWNVTTDVVDTTARAGAPANATRVILYTINATTRRPIEPLVEVGYVDLFAHENFPDSSSLRFLVSSSTPAVVGDFTAIAGTNVNSSARVTGFVTSGTRRVDFTFPYTVQTPNTLIGTDWDMVSPASRISNRSVIVQAGDSIGAEVTLTFESQDVQSLFIGELPPGAAMFGRQEVGVGENLEFFGSVTVTATGVSGAGPDGRPLTTDEFNALNQLRSLSLDLTINVHRPVLTSFYCGGC